jgi:acetyl-CoA synthetase
MSLVPRYDSIEFGEAALKLRTFRQELISSNLVNADTPGFRAKDIRFGDNLPKTRSGKIMRRILRKIAEGDFSSFGDTSTLLNPEIVDEIKEGKI